MQTVRYLQRFARLSWHGRTQASPRLCIRCCWVYFFYKGFLLGCNTLFFFSFQIYPVRLFGVFGCVCVCVCVCLLDTCMTYVKLPTPIAFHLKLLPEQQYFFSPSVFFSFSFHSVVFPLPLSLSFVFVFLFLLAGAKITTSAYPYLFHTHTQALPHNPPPHAHSNQQVCLAHIHPGPCTDIVGRCSC